MPDKPSKQAAYVKRRKERGDTLVQVWMDAETLALWQRLYPKHGGMQQAISTAVRLLQSPLWEPRP